MQRRGPSVRRLALAPTVLLAAALAGEASAQDQPRLVVQDAPGQETLVGELLLALRIAIPELRVERDDGSEALARVAITPEPHAVLVQIAVPWSRLAVERRVAVGDAAPPEIAEALALVVRSLLSLALLDTPERTEASAALVHIAQPRAEVVARRLVPTPRRERAPGGRIPLRLAAGATVVFGSLPFRGARFGARIAFGARARIARVAVEATTELELLAPLTIDQGPGVHLVYRGFPVSAWVGVPLVLGAAKRPVEVTPAFGLIVERSQVTGSVMGRGPVSFADWNAALGLRGRLRYRITGRLWAEGGLRFALPLGGQHYRHRQQSVLETPGLALAADIGLSADLP